MLENLTSTKAVGLFFSGPKLKVAHVIIEKGIPNITSCDTLDLELDDHVKRLDIPDDQTVITSSLPARDVLVRQLLIKLTKKKDVAAVLPFQAEPLIPFPIEETALESVEISQTKSGTNLTILGVKKDQIRAHLESLEELGVDPEVVSTSPVALSIFANALNTSGKDMPTLILHFGLEETLCVLAENGKLLAEHTIPFGLSQAISASGQVDVYEIDFSKERLEKTSALQDFVTRLKQEVTRTIFSLVKQHKGEQIAKVLLTGQGASLNGIEAVFSEGLHVEVSRPESQFGQPGRVLQEYAIPIGLALGSVNGDDQEVNFRKGEFAYGDPWKRMKIPLLAYFGMTLLTAGILYLAGNSWINSSFDGVKEDYSRLLAEIEQPYTAFEQEYRNIHPYDDALSLKAMTPDQLFNRLELLQEKMLKSPSTFELLPNVPRVSDVLGWLANHPLVTDPSTQDPLLNIKNFQYTMVKRPDAKKRNEKYRVKVEIEFTSDIPKLAREFHDALIAPNDIVDPKGEVKWTTSRGSYRTSFYLKNRTPKPMKRSPLT